jgi:hypothetical protein
MPLYGEGVTRNFLTILEYDNRRTAKSLAQIGIAAFSVFLLSWVFLHELSLYSLLIVPGAFLLAFVLGIVYTKFFVLESYEVSLRDHWNRWMRWSVSCRTVRECYSKVHGRSQGPSWWWGGVALTVLVVFHLVFFALIFDGITGLAEVLPLFVVDAILVGLFGGRRFLEARWYRGFLRSCNQLLQDGSIGLWGIL